MQKLQNQNATTCLEIMT